MPCSNARADRGAKQRALNCSGGIRCSLLLAWRDACVQGVKILTWFEAHCLARSDVDLSPGTGVAANACFPRTDAEDAKAAQFDALSSCQSLFKALEDRIHCRLGLGTRQARTLDHVVNDILFNQWSILAGSN